MWSDQSLKVDEIRCLGPFQSALRSLLGGETRHGSSPRTRENRSSLTMEMGDCTWSDQSLKVDEIRINCMFGPFQECPALPS